MKDKSVVKVSMQAPLRSITIENLNPYDYLFIKDYIAFKKKETKEMCKKAGINDRTTQSNILFSMILDYINYEMRKDKKFAKEFDKFCEGGNITRSDDKIYDSDIEYYLKEKNQMTCNKTAKGIITLCGSTRFYETFLEINNKLTAKGYIVLSIGVVKSKAVMLDKSDTELEKMLDNLHREKILMSDSIFVIDQDDYIGKSTKDEIEFAKKHKKRIYKLSNGDLNKL